MSPALHRALIIKDLNDIPDSALDEIQAYLRTVLSKAPHRARTEAPATPTADRGHLPMDPELSQVKFHEDPVAPLEPDDWPDSED